MHGNNVVRGFDDKADKIQLHEVFYTIQGEGLFSGQRAVFVRLTGCNLRCFFCDTTWGDENDPWQTVAEIVARVQELAPDGLVVLTGGEPVRQALAGALVQSLLQQGYHVQVETAGTIWQDWLDQAGVTVCVSPKTGRVHQNFELVLERPRVFWKYVIEANGVLEDGLPSGDYQRHKDGVKRIGGVLRRPPAGALVYITPMDVGDPEGNALNYLEVAGSAMQFGYIAQLQVHKYLNLR